jgi:hypothetical protein
MSINYVQSLYQEEVPRESAPIRVPEVIPVPDLYTDCKEVCIDFEGCACGAWCYQADVVTFLDEDEGQKIGSAAGNHAFATADATDDTEIAKFLNRPVRIDSHTWTEAMPVGIYQSLLPWYLWANTDTIKNKLNNYAFMRGDLHIKIVISASPFYYGLNQVSYTPLSGFKATTIDTVNSNYLVNLSQRPHIYLNPGESSGGELTLPFIYHKNYLTIASATEFQKMGTLDYCIYANLLSANGTSSPVTITTYAWMDNLTLSGATSTWSLQCDVDEYGDGVVSRPASWIAKGAGYLEKMPVIGRFATATRIGASAVSSIASLFGFTNVPVIENTDPVRVEAFPKFASSEISFPVEKLTLDPKNELSIDPRVVGLSDGTDEMMISRITSHNSFLAKAVWSQSNLVDDVLFYSRINPRMYDYNLLSAPVQNAISMTPLCWASQPFAHWRGDIIFQFKIVASKYHKGRVRVSFDPSGSSAQNLSTLTNTTNVVHTTIVDLGETNDVEFRVPYQQAAQFLAMRFTGSTTSNWGVNSAIPNAPFPYDPFYDNGLISVRVLSVLSAPIPSAPVSIMIYVRGAENLELANPSDVSNRYSYFQFQSETIKTVEDALHSDLGTINTPVDNQYLVHFGENIRSFRQLLRRYNYHSTDWFQHPTSTTEAKISRGFKHYYKLPTTPGVNSNGPNVAAKLNGGAPVRYNFCQMTTLAWLANGYIAYRGSVNWSHNLVTDTYPIDEVLVRRNIGAGFPTSYTVVNTNEVYDSSVARAMLDFEGSFGSGLAMTNCSTQSGLNVQCPMYSAFKFQYTTPSNANLGVAEDGSVLDMFTLRFTTKVPKNAAQTTSTYLNNYVGIGTDFSLHLFINVPTVYSTNVIPLASYFP